MSVPYPTTVGIHIQGPPQVYPWRYLTLLLHNVGPNCKFQTLILVLGHIFCLWLDLYLIFYQIQFFQTN